MLGQPPTPAPVRGLDHQSTVYLLESFGDRCCESRQYRYGADHCADNDPPTGANQVDQIRNDPFDVEKSHSLTPTCHASRTGVSSPYQ